MRRALRSLALLTLAFCFCDPALGDPPAAAPETQPTALKLPAIFGDHMMIQRDASVAIWGWAAPGEGVKITAGASTASTTADAHGKWMTKLDPQKFSATPIAITISAPSKTITLNDVLIGDVWLCSGQSNMAFPVGQASNAAETLAAAKRPDIRLFKVKTTPTPEPQDDCTGQWQVSSAASAKGFSAVGYFFGKNIADSQKIPVGLIDATQGATPAQAWISAAALARDPDLEKTYLAPVKALLADPAATTAAHDKWLAAGGSDYLAARAKWYQDRYVAEKNKQTSPPAPVPSSPEPLHFDNPIRFPTVLYNGMISPLAPYSLKGALWYQGESNAGDAALYGKLLTGLIECWRDRWQNQELPFYIVQLPNHGGRSDSPDQGMGGWPRVREQERLIARNVPNCGFAVTVDIGQGSNLHPPFKCEVGRRLALTVRQNIYGETIVGTSPAPESWKIDGDKMEIKFSNVGEALKIGAPPKGSLTPAPSATELKGFSIAGSDHKFVWAQAKITGKDTVVVSSPDVKTPTVVRYGWGADPEVNLYNSADLPASPFSTDPPAGK